MIASRNTFYRLNEKNGVFAVFVSTMPKPPLVRGVGCATPGGPGV